MSFSLVLNSGNVIGANNNTFQYQFSLSLSLRQVASAKQRFLSHRLFVENLLSGFELCIPIIIILTYQYTKSDICFSFSKNSSAKNMSY